MPIFGDAYIHLTPVLRRLARAPDRNAGVKRPGYDANNFRVPCRGSAVAVHSF